MYRSFIGLTTALCLTVVACGDSLTGVDSGDPLSSAEVAAVVAAFASSLEQTGVSAQAPAQAPISVDTGVNISVPCDSGTFDVAASLDGTVDDETFDADVTMNVSWTPNGCEVTDGANTFTLDGDPRIELDLTLVSSGENLSITGTEQGGFSYTTSDGRTGSCAIDVTFSFVSTGSSLEASVTGTICGLSADAFATLGYDAPQA